MLEEQLLIYTRSVLKSSDNLKALLGEDFEVYWGQARREPRFNYINVLSNLRNMVNDAVLRGTYNVDIWTNDLDATSLVRASFEVQKLLHRLYIPGGCASRLYFRGRDYFTSDETLQQVAMYFNIRGVDGV